MAWSSAPSDLRTLLCDGPTDKLASRKRCIGVFNGANLNFKTFEARRVTNFNTGSAWPLGVYKNNNTTAEVVDQDDVVSGSFQLHTAPADGDTLEATYYYQYFVDTEITQFLTDASRWLTSQDDYTQIAQGLWTCALKYGAAEAYQKMSVRNLASQSATYRTEDAPDVKNQPQVDQFAKMSKTFRDDALALRDEYYTRQGQSEQPLWSNNYGNVKDVAPNK